MSEYDDYNEKLFHQSQQNSLRDDSNYDAEYIDFNPAFSFNLCRIDNTQFQTKHFQEKQENDVDTDYTLRPKENLQMENISAIKIRQFRKIDTNPKIQNSYLKAKRGSAKQTMQLNINFKTIFCKVIRDLIDMRLLKKGEKDLFLKYKSQSPSFKSLANFLDTAGNLESKQRLKQLMSTSSILVKIQQSDLRIDNKIIMLKFLQVMRLTVIQGNNEKKWKKMTT